MALGAAQAEVSEGGGGVTITVTRTGGSAGEATVLLTASGGTAVPGRDYIGLAKVLDFQDGETAKTLFFPVFDNATPDGDRTAVRGRADPRPGARSDGQAARDRRRALPACRRFRALSGRIAERLDHNGRVVASAVRRR